MRLDPNLHTFVIEAYDPEVRVHVCGVFGGWCGWGKGAITRSQRAGVLKCLGEVS